MYPKLKGWTLTTGRISSGETHYQNPRVSEVLASLDRIPPEIKKAYVSLGKSPEDAICQNYCLATIVEEGFCYEIRHYGLLSSDYCHYRMPPIRTLSARHFVSPEDFVARISNALHDRKSSFLRNSEIPS